MKNAFIALMLLAALLGVSCNNDDPADFECSEDLVCTLQFISYHVTVSDTNGNPVALDSFSVTDVDTGEDLTRTLSAEEFAQVRALGAYPLYDDLTDANNPGISRLVVFQGSLGQESISSEYEVGRGCCHAGTPEGNLNLIWE